MTPMLSLRSPVDLLAAVPYLFGFHPADSVVLLALRGTQVAFQARAGPDAVAGQLADVLRRQRFRQVLIVGYGPAGTVDPMVHTLRDRLAAVSIRTVEALRVAAGRYWSYTCARPECCPPDGNPYLPDSTPIAAQATVAGLVALPSRDDVRARLAPVSGAARAAMRRAAERADARARQLVDAALTDPPSGDASGEAVLRAATARFAGAGRSAVDHAETVHREGRALADDAAAWLAVLLVHLPVRDHAWERIPADPELHLALWADLTRRAEPELRAAPATLLAYAAWHAGEGATTTIALECALESDPDYAMAQLLTEAITAGLDPAALCAPRRQPLPRRRQRRSG